MSSRKKCLTKVLENTRRSVAAKERNKALTNRKAIIKARAEQNLVMACAEHGGVLKGARAAQHKAFVNAHIAPSVVLSATK